MSDDTASQVNLLDLLAFVLRWRKAILVSVIIVSIIVAIVSFLVAPVYRSSGIVRGVESSSQTIGSLISSKLASLGGIAGFAPGLGELSGQLFVVILQGRSMSERMIEEFDLREVYGAGDVPIEEVIEILKSKTSFELEHRSSTIIIDVEDTSPERARDMVDFYMRELDHEILKVNATRAAKEREFVGSRLAEARGQLADLEDSLHAFQIKTGVLDIEEQVKATVQAAAALEAQKLLTQAELELNTQIFDPGSAEIQLLQMKLAGIDSSLATLIRRRDADTDPDFLVRLMDTPEQGKTYLRLMREIEIQQLVVLYLTQQYEQEKIESVRNTPTLSIIQPPVVPTKRVWPRRGLMVGLAAFGAFAFVCLVGLIVEYFRNAARNTAHPQHARIQKLRRDWSG